eukprot:3342311-Pyramimonas_sp.AAC.1
MTKQHKLRVLQACVFSKLLYGLESCVLLQADKNRLDGFQAKCYRRVLKIQPAFLSFFSNQRVLLEAQSPPLSTILLERQLKYCGKLARAPSQSLPKAMVFQPGEAHSLMPREWRSLKNRGRPRLQWTSYMHARALRVAGDDPDRLQILLNSPPREWDAAVKEYCKQSV